jgi:hypothetical protein
MLQCENTLNSAATRVDNLQTTRTVGWVAAGVGAATFVTGVVLVLTTGNPHKYDEKPVDRLFAGWQVVPQIGIGGVSMFASRSF